MGPVRDAGKSQSFEIGKNGIEGLRRFGRFGGQRARQVAGFDTREDRKMTRIVIVGLDPTRGAFEGRPKIGHSARVCSAASRNLATALRKHGLGGFSFS